MEPKTIGIGAGIAVFGAALVVVLVGGGEPDSVAEKQASREKLSAITEPALTKGALVAEAETREKDNPKKFVREYNDAIIPLRARDATLVDLLTPFLGPGESTNPADFGVNLPFGARLATDATNHILVDWPTGDAIDITGGKCEDKPHPATPQTWCGFTVVNNTAEARRAVFLVRYTIPEKP